MKFHVKLQHVPLQLLLLLSLVFWNCNSGTGFSRQDKTSGGFALTFDDNEIESWYSISDLLSEFDARATFFISGFQELSEFQINLLHQLEAGGHEIALHGVNHVELNPYLADGGSINSYFAEEIEPELNAMRNEGFNPISFAYPAGSRNKSADKYLSSHFKILRAVSESQRHKPAKNIRYQNDVYADPEGNSIVFGFGIDDQMQVSENELINGLSRAGNEGEVLVLYAHKPAKTEDYYQVDFESLRLILITAESMGLKSYRISDLAGD